MIAKKNVIIEITMHESDNRKNDAKNKQTSKTTIETNTGWKYTKIKFFKFIPTFTYT
ncbi:Protein of unknown function [Bacillus cytotoxicus]|nr:Protein of unknown function [Bacillus cytotoxicus]